MISQLARTIAFGRAGNVPTLGPMPRPQHPQLIEVDYGKAIIASAVEPVVVALAQLRAEAPKLVADATRARGDGESALAKLQRMRRGERFDEAGVAARAHQLAEAARGAVPSHVGADATASKYGQRIVAHATDQLRDQIAGALGPDVAAISRAGGGRSGWPLVHHWTAENTALIRSVAIRHIDDAEKIVTRAIAGGDGEGVAEDLAKRAETARSQARVIARDQTGNLNGRAAVTLYRQLGITRFRWRVNLGDPNIRGEHRARDGRIYSLDAPPADGIPGTPSGCHCSMEPVLEDVVAELG